MSTITPTQCQCARVLLKWDQNDLATRCGLHVQTICLFETEQSTPTRRTLDKITTALENAGVEFLEGDGVKKKTGEIKTLYGVDGFREFLDHVYDIALNKAGKIFVLNSKHTNFYKWCGGEEWYKKHAKRMSVIANQIDARVIVEEEDNQFIGNTFAEYRWFPKSMWNDQTIYSYGEYLAFLNFQENDVCIMILKHAQFTEGFRVLYDIAWKHAAHPPQPS